VKVHRQAATGQQQRVCQAQPAVYTCCIHVHGTSNAVRRSRRDPTVRLLNR
jgi:hypothetical protein